MTQRDSLSNGLVFSSFSPFLLSAGTLYRALVMGYSCHLLYILTYCSSGLQEYKLNPGPTLPLFSESAE